MPLRLKGKSFQERKWTSCRRTYMMTMSFLASKLAIVLTISSDMSSDTYEKSLPVRMALRKERSI